MQSMPAIDALRARRAHAAERVEHLERELDRLECSPGAAAVRERLARAVRAVNWFDDALAAAGARC
jgi:hypothetical protein